MGTLSSLRTKVANNLGGRDDKNTIIDATINSVVLMLARKYNWDDLADTDSSLTLSAAANTVTLASTVRKVDRVVLKNAGGSYYPINKISRHAFRDRHWKIVPTSTALPIDCYVMGGKIYFDRLADENYTVYLDVWLYPTDMTGDSSTPSVSGVDDYIVALSTARMYLHLHKMEEASDWLSLAEMIGVDVKDETMGEMIDSLEPY